MDNNGRLKICLKELYEERWVRAPKAALKAKLNVQFSS